MPSFNHLVESVDLLEPETRARLEELYGALDDVDFIVYWRKYSDEADAGFTWDGWPFTSLGRSAPVRVDDPENWKATWFIFTH